MLKIKKVSFRVRRIYYDMFLNGTKREELRAVTPYWFKILRPHVDPQFYFHPEIVKADDNKEFFYRPRIAVVPSPGQPSLYFAIRYISIAKTEEVLDRKILEQGKKDIPSELCIVTKMGERINSIQTTIRDYGQNRNLCF